LSENKGSLSLTLTIDKSVSKVASWLIGCMIASVVLSVLALALAYTANNRANDIRDFADARYADLAQRFQMAEREARVATERWNDLKVELAKRDIPVSDH
jgi:hypothetical protein